MSARTSTHVHALDSATAAEFKTALRGEVVLPGDPRYDAARSVWNGLIDKHPAVIARCAGAEDVVAAVRLARDHRLEVAIRGGGHSTSGLAVCDGGLMIDLSPMKGIRVDPARGTVYAEPGLRLGELLGETQAFGLAATTGTVSDTGLAGLALGGGMGYLMGKYGRTVDNLLAAEVVTSDGLPRTASAEEHPDLFWAIRGGGGNFGVVTSFLLQLHPVGRVLAGMLVHPVSRAAEGLRFYRAFTRDCPDELTVYAALVTAPDGEPALAFIACYTGDFQRGERALASRCAGPVCEGYIVPSLLLPLLMLAAAAVTGLIAVVAARQGGRDARDPVDKRRYAAWLALLGVCALVSVLGPIAGVVIWRDQPDAVVVSGTALVLLLPVCALMFTVLAGSSRKRS